MVVFNDAGELVGVHNEWKFDEAYSAWIVQGLDRDGDGELSGAEMQAFASESMTNLADYNYYTSAGEGSTSLTFGKGRSATAQYENGRATLSFFEPLVQPHRIVGALELGIADPEFYVDIAFDGTRSITLAKAPSDCRFQIEPGQGMSEELATKLYSIPADVTKVPPELERELRGVQDAILVKCGAGTLAAADAPTNALDAIDALNTGLLSATGNASLTVPMQAPIPAMEPAGLRVPGATEKPAPEPVKVAQIATTSSSVVVPAARSRSSPAPAQAAGVLGFLSPRLVPFNGPPLEPGLPMARTGILGWVADMQKSFYAAISDALGRIKADNNAFWLLGGLSFLYGIFHAAGPGHGKVVISSYVLANEQQLRRGVLLSFISAMVQSAVAVVFVLAAVTVLHLTSIAMSAVANWIGIVSYGLVVLLGVWLILRKLFFSHHHGHATHRHDLAHHHHDDDHHHPHHHEDDDEHDHVHVVTPQVLRGGWREQLAVVLGVGLRPCSGALVVLVFALSQDVVPAGIAAVFLMGLGTAITVAVLATMASSAKGLALRFAGLGGASVAAGVIWWLELAGAAAVLAFGTLLLLASF